MKAFDFLDDRFICTLMLQEVEKRLEFDYKTCSGCGICIDICPTDALELGPIKEIATGLDAPPVLIDVEKCVFCGMCAAFCPEKCFLFIKKKDGACVDILEDDRFAHLDGMVEVNDKCLPCVLCEKTCQNSAITLTLEQKRKEDIVEFDPEQEGSIRISEERCNFCGLCGRFCDAFVFLEKGQDQEDENLIPFEPLLIDTSKCDYCKLCKEVCPEDAIEVESDCPEPGEIKSQGSIEINMGRCDHCRRCEIICPFDAIEVETPIDGEIRIIERNLPRCDPIGCAACIKICPSKAWYRPAHGDEKIAVRKDICFYCGACVNVCPDDVIGMERGTVSHTETRGAAWKTSWDDAVETILGKKQRRKPDLDMTVEVVVKDEGSEAVETKSVVPVDLKNLNAVLQPLMDSLDKVKVRYSMERR